MQAYPRVRKTIKWGGAVVSVLLVTVWVSSAFSFTGYEWQRGSFSVSRGRVGIASFAANFQNARGLICQRRPNPELEWWFQVDYPGNDRWLRIPIWTLTLIAGSSAGIAWRLDTLARRRARLNRCPKCNYDRTGLASGAKCPECGAAPVNV